MGVMAGASGYQLGGKYRDVSRSIVPVKLNIISMNPMSLNGMQQSMTGSFILEMTTMCTCNHLLNMCIHYKGFSHAYTIKYRYNPIYGM